MFFKKSGEIYLKSLNESLSTVQNDHRQKIDQMSQSLKEEEEKFTKDGLLDDWESRGVASAFLAIRHLNEAAFELFKTHRFRPFKKEMIEDYCSWEMNVAHDIINSGLHPMFEIYDDNHYVLSIFEDEDGHVVTRSSLDTFLNKMFMKYGTYPIDVHVFKDAFKEPLGKALMGTDSYRVMRYGESVIIRPKLNIPNHRFVFTDDELREFGCSSNDFYSAIYGDFVFILGKKQPITLKQIPIKDVIYSMFKYVASLNAGWYTSSDILKMEVVRHVLSFYHMKQLTPTSLTSLLRDCGFESKKDGKKLLWKMGEIHV